MANYVAGWTIPALLGRRLREPRRPSWRLGIRHALAIGLLASGASIAQGAGTWTRLVRNAPGPVVLMMLLSDGTVMAANNSNAIGNAWYRLTPDSHGSYLNGTWITLAPMHDTRLYYSSAVLKDGRVFVAGGEYGTGASTSEVYDPISNSWTIVPVPVALTSTVPTA